MKKQFIILLAVIAIFVACSKSKENNTFPNQQLILGKWNLDSLNLLIKKISKDSTLTNKTVVNTDNDRYFQFSTAGVLISRIDTPSKTAQYSFLDNNRIKVIYSTETNVFNIKKLDTILILNSYQAKNDTSNSLTFFFNKMK